ncbi:hypothetical protein TNCV_113791 [Trichonephila clavipes]|nr:hypothetical protein TNCV_113791 [Trichonephila clavipes]
MSVNVPLLNAYYALPVLFGNSLLNVSSSHCMATPEMATFSDIPKGKNPEWTRLVKVVVKVLWKSHDIREIQLKLPYCPVMCDTLHRLAATKIPFITFQQEYEFHYNVYVDGRSFHCTSL